MDKSEIQTIIFYRWLVFTCLLPHIMSMLRIPSFGLAWTGYAWTIMFIVSLYYVFFVGKIRMKWWIWIPWIFIVILYYLFDFTYFGLQASSQYICSIFTGMAASVLNYNEYILKKLFKWVVYLSLFFSIFRFLASLIGIYFGDIALLVMLYTFLSSVILSVAFVYKKKKYFILYGIMLLITVSIVTRMGIAMMLVVLAFHFANKKVYTKILMGGLVVILGIIIFNTEGFQKKAFGNKAGTVELSDLSFEGGRIKNINTNGRDFMWNLMDEGIKESPLWGHGSRADLKLLKSANLPFTECHNDYKAVKYNYGKVGLGCLIFGFLAQFFILLLNRKKVIDKKTLVVYYAALTSTLVWFGFMYSDNILKYATQFGNFFFVLYGIFYSRIKTIKYDISSSPIIQ